MQKDKHKHETAPEVDIHITHIPLSNLNPPESTSQKHVQNQVLRIDLNLVYGVLSPRSTGSSTMTVNIPKKTDESFLNEFSMEVEETTIAVPMKLCEE